ncbi:amidohydrolase family protein [Aquibium sp. A9E412]|uniref:amidohydrolase family protein n=1 Tax=Aquibium sp. A9E412 TaxID=2976767 RepID=UPI0025B1DE48|nr:amidohydrolase family protein [Aquibium sp. A9E412]MDN2567771.1 amidohydrolase family protein [Aquibium sp. A9E412]
MATRLVANGTIVTMDADRAIIEDGALVIRDSRIAAVGPTAELAGLHPNAEVIDATGMLVVPGLIDGHNHPLHFLSKGLFDDIALAKRWATRLYPFETSISEAQTYVGSLASFAEMLLSGTTCVVDPGSMYPEATIRAAEEIGMRLVTCFPASDVSSAERPLPEHVRGTAEELTARSEALFRDWNGHADDRIRISFGLRNAAVSDALCLGIKRLSDRHGAMIHTHLAVTDAERAMIEAAFGESGIDRFARLGLLDGALYAAHMGALSQRELETVIAAGTVAAHCPSASMLGAFGCIAHGRFPELVAAGAPVTLGTDGASISRFLDMVRIMYLAACAHKDARQDAEVMGWRPAFEMATAGAAAALGWDDAIGSLEAGKRADLVLVRTDGLEWCPRPGLNPVANLVYASGGHRVDTVFVNGRRLVAGGRLTAIDTQALKDKAIRAAHDAQQSSGIPADPVWPVRNTATLREGIREAID